MSSRSVRKRRHREDFAEYNAARQQFKGIASQWKKFGFPNETAFIKALLEHSKNRDNPIPDVEPAHVDVDLLSGTHEHGEGCTHHHDDRSVHAHVHGENCDHDDPNENHDAAEEAEQQKLRDGIEDSYAADRAALDHLPDFNE